MKQKDILLIIVIVIVSGVLSVVISSILIGTPTTRREKAEVVDQITTKFDPPSKKYFNDKSINPTQLIRISENKNQQPFNK